MVTFVLGVAFVFVEEVVLFTGVFDGVLVVPVSANVLELNDVVVLSVALEVVATPVELLMIPDNSRNVAAMSDNKAARRRGPLYVCTRLNNSCSLNATEGLAIQIWKVAVAVA